MLQKKPYIGYNAGNTQFARTMRKNPTPTEKIMREQILKKRPLGTKWWRQKPLGPYIADFYCPALQMIIEIDGGYHEKTVEYDAQRDARCDDHGFVVLRIKNEKFEDIVMVERLVIDVIARLYQISSTL